MDDKRQQPRIACTTPVCWNDGKLSFIGDWQTNDYCEYIMVECPNCSAKYWMIKRNGKYEIKWREDGEDFDHRKNDREDNQARELEH